MYFIVPPHLTCASALTGETANRKPENCIFSLKCCMLFIKNTLNTLKYHLVTAEPSFTVKTTDWMHQTGPMILLSVTRMLYVNQVCHGVGRCVNTKQWELFFVKPECKSMDSINGMSYYLNKIVRRYQTNHR